MNYPSLSHVPKESVPLDRLGEVLKSDLLDKTIFRMDVLVNMMERTTDADVREGICEILQKVILNLSNTLDNDLNK